MAWTLEQQTAIHAAVSGGETARSVADRLGVSRNAVLGVVHRYRAANGTPRVRKAEAPKPPKAPDPPRAPEPPPAAVMPKPSAFLFRAPGRLRPSLVCDAETLSGPCGRPACVEGRCLGHRWLTIKPGERLRPPAPRITSTMAVERFVDSNMAKTVDKAGRERVPGRWRNDSELARKASSFGWVRLSEDTWARRAA